jgi:hypothetical protein
MEQSCARRSQFDATAYGLSTERVPPVPNSGGSISATKLAASPPSAGNSADRHQLAIVDFNARQRGKQMLNHGNTRAVRACKHGA